METIKKEAIELLKKETTKMKELRIKNGEFEFKGECADVGESYSEFVLDGLGGMRYSIHDYDAAGTLLGIWKKEFGKIQPGDYFIARKPKRNSAPLSWCASMDKYDGIIQKCKLITRYGNIATGMDGFIFHPEWCEKVSPGDVMKRDNGDIFIFREIIDGETFHHAFYNPTYDHLSTSKDCSICSKTPVRAIHATNEEAQPLFNALAKNGKKWNKEKLQVEDIKWVPKAGEFVAHKDGWIHIHKGIEEDGRVKHYAAMSPGGYVYYNDFVGFESDLRGPATESEKIKLIEAIGKEGKQWNEEKMCVEDIPKPKTENSFRQLPFIDVLYESYMLYKRKSLKQIIKLCKQLLNE